MHFVCDLRYSNCVAVFSIIICWLCDWKKNFKRVNEFTEECEKEFLSNCLAICVTTVTLSVCVCVCVCVCECERERERESEYVCVCVCVFIC